ncbi:MAG: SH3 domain-containing protein [Bdellovibrionota bacterium]
MKATPLYGVIVRLLLLLSFPALSFAAQNALITAEEAQIRERPSFDSRPVGSQKSGDAVRISTQSKDGWFKIKAPSGQYGWIWQGDLTVASHSDEFRSADLELKEKAHQERRRTMEEPWLFLSAGGWGYFLTASGLSSKLGLSKNKLYFAPGGFGEAAVRLSDIVRIGLRVGGYSHTTSKINAAGEQYSASISATPVFAGLQLDVVQGKAFDVTLGAYAGLALGNTLTVTATSSTAPNGFTFKEDTFAAMGLVSAKYWVIHSLAVFAEIGGYYTRIPKKNFKEPFNGDLPFRNGTDLGSLQVTTMGPVISLGLQLALAPF